LGSISPRGGRPAASGRIVLPPSVGSVDVEWTWDAGRRAWLRQQDGRPHRVSAGRQIATENIVVVTGAPASGNRGAGSETAGAIAAVGEGEAVVLRDGLAYDARWRRASLSSRFEWTMPSGSPLPLAPGRTWIEFIPVSGSLTVDRLP